MDPAFTTTHQAITGAQTQTHAVVGTPASGTLLTRHVNNVISGGSITLFLVAVILFLRFFRKTGDRFFLFFAAAFGIMCIDNLSFHFTDTNDEARTYLYVVRLLAFLLIIYAVIDKNLGRARGARRS